MKEILKNGLQELGFPASDELLDQFEIYAKTLVLYNEKVNLTAITDPQEIAVKHFLDSVAPLALIPHANTLIDVGTGAGFPGLPMKLMKQELRLTLLDSLEKRVEFLRYVCCQMKLAGVDFVHARAEDAARALQYRESFDAAVARAVAPLRVLCEYCLPFVKVGGIFLACKGPSVLQEAEDCKNALKLLGGEISDIVSVSIPGADLDHKAVIVQKVRQTPQGYPRKAGKPTKNPL